MQTPTPLSLEVALTVQQELQSRLDEAGRLRQQRVERARYEAALAQRRYMNVNPSNRLVVDTLEADWNQRLRALAAAQDECERQQRTDRAAIGEQGREAVMALSRDFQRVWENPHTPDRERKRLVRHLLEDVTLVRQEQISVHIRFRGGVIRSLTLPLPQSAAQLRKTKPGGIAEIDRLLNTNTENEIASISSTKKVYARERARRLTAQSSCVFAMVTISKTASRDTGRQAYDHGRNGSPAACLALHREKVAGQGAAARASLQ